jgi:rhamnulokinase
VHVVGGGSRNEALCQLTARRVGLPLTAGPAEATALGNALVQARALDDSLGDLDALRSIVRRSHPPRTIEPSRQGAIP